MFPDIKWLDFRSPLQLAIALRGIVILLQKLQILTFQERGIRSGTVPTPLVVGLGEACRIAQQEMSYDAQHVSRLSQRLKSKIAAALEFVVVNGDTEHTYPGTVMN